MILRYNIRRETVMRIFNIFLVLNIVICYGGLCGDAVYSITLSDSETQSCHKMDHDNTQMKNEITILGNGVKEDIYGSDCCLNSLLNSAPDAYSKADFTHTHLLPITSPNIGQYKTIKSSQDRLLREHDPPDLQTSYSTFLL